MGTEKETPLHQSQGGPEGDQRLADYDSSEKFQEWIELMRTVKIKQIGRASCRERVYVLV